MSRNFRGGDCNNEREGIAMDEPVFLYLDKDEKKGTEKKQFNHR
jgi:hypothetical protein